MRSLAGWILLIAIWLTVTFGAYLACAAINTPEGHCDPLTAVDRCENGPSLTGPGGRR